MKLLVATDAYIYRTPDGAHWCSALYGYDYFSRFFTSFDTVRVVARVKETDTVPERWLRTDGERVEVYGIPFFRGPKQLLPVYFSVRRRLKRAADGCDAAFLRVPGQTAHMTYDCLPKTMPVAAEAVADFTCFIENKNESLLMRLLYRVMGAKYAKIMRSANGAVYVTKETIQKHYPSHAALYGESERYFEQYCSDIALTDGDFRAPRRYEGKKRFTLIHTDAAMNAQRKGERQLLNVTAALRSRGFDVHTVFVGDGILRESFEKQTAALGISDAVTFTGMLSSRAEVTQALDRADFYVLPTDAEGLSRGIVEAMAMALPVLSSPVGGTPELLPAACLADAHDEEAYARILSDWMSHPEIPERLSRENAAHAQEFRKEILEEKRKEFYARLGSLAENGRETVGKV